MSKAIREVAKRTGFSIAQVEHVINSYHKLAKIAFYLGKAILFSDIGTFKPDDKAIMNTVVSTIMGTYKNGKPMNWQRMNFLKQHFPIPYRKGLEIARKHVEFNIEEYL